MHQVVAGTSTGGLTNKRCGRIGDSPIIGAGTYANNNTCAISCTGKGEDFIRLGVAGQISSAMEYGGLSLDSAVNLVIQNKLKTLKGRGGCIGLDRWGNISMSFTTTGMFRGYIDQRNQKFVAIYE
jgi:beta-aspartyl-peptidase (threonine type)